MKALFVLFSGLLLGQTPTSVKLQVSGLPSGQQQLPSIIVTLPSGKSIPVQAVTDFAASETGRYRVVADHFRVEGKIVDRVFEAPAVDRVVKPGETVILQVAFRQRQGSGMMWAATARINEDTDDFSQGTVRALDEAQLVSGAFSKPSAQMLTGPRLGGGIAGPDGSFYFVDGWSTNALMRLLPTSLTSTGTARSSKVAGTDNRQAGISPDGGLWELHDRILRQLSSGALTPSKALVELTLREEDDGLPTGHFLFLRNGDLLLYGGGGAARIPASKLTPGKREIGRGDAAANVSFSSGAIGHGALDEAGNLWMPDENSQVLQIPSSVLEKGGKVQATSFEVPQSASAIRVDNEGGVWCLIRYTGEMHYRAPGSASFVLKGSFGRGFDEHTQLTLNPPPAWSPLAAAPTFPRRLPR